MPIDKISYIRVFAKYDTDNNGVLSSDERKNIGELYEYMDDPVSTLVGAYNAQSSGELPFDKDTANLSFWEYLEAVNRYNPDSPAIVFSKSEEENGKDPVSLLKIYAENDPEATKALVDLTIQGNDKAYDWFLGGSDQRGSNVESLILKSTFEPSKLSGAMATIKKLPTGPEYCRKLITESSFYVTYWAAMRLAETENAEAPNVISQMIQNKSDVFEQAMGLLVFGARVQAVNNRNMMSMGESFSSARFIQYFLNSKSELLQFYAAFSLIWMRTAQAEYVLRDFASHNHSRAVGKMIDDLLPAGRTIDSLPYNMANWREPLDYKTYFFRFPDICDELKNEIKCHPDSFTVWEAGCSVGLTTESMSIALNNEINTSKTKVNIIGTDIDPFALWYAKRGEYLLDLKSLVSKSYVINTDSWGSSGKDLFNVYSEERGLNADSILNCHFSRSPGDVSGSIISSAKRDQYPISFLYDDITSKYSPVPDNSVDGIVYTNVHYELSEASKPKAIEKIARKLKPGGKIYFLDSSESYREFKQYFGAPIDTNYTNCEICFHVFQKKQ